MPNIIAVTVVAGRIGFLPPALYLRLRGTGAGLGIFTGEACGTERRASAPSPPGGPPGAGGRAEGRRKGGSASRPLRPGCAGRARRTPRKLLQEVHFTTRSAGAARAPGSASRPSATSAAWTGATEERRATSAEVPLGERREQRTAFMLPSPTQTAYDTDNQPNDYDSGHRSNPHH